MKVTAYFFDVFTNESIYIAIPIWIIYYIAFVKYIQTGNQYYDIYTRLVLSLTFASFTCLFFADSLLEYTIFFIGVSILIFGSLSSVNMNNNSLKAFLVGICCSIVASIILYTFRTQLYNRKKIPQTKGRKDLILSPGAFVWNITMLLMYTPILFRMVK